MTWQVQHHFHTSLKKIVFMQKLIQTSLVTTIIIIPWHTLMINEMAVEMKWKWRRKVGFYASLTHLNDMVSVSLYDADFLYMNVINCYNMVRWWWTDRPLSRTNKWMRCYEVETHTIHTSSYVDMRSQ